MPFAGDEERRAFAIDLLAGRDEAMSRSERRQPGAYLWWLWQKGATLEGLHWYVSERAKYSDHGLMAAEYPSDDVEAFVHSGARVFDKYKVEALRGGCRQPDYRGEITGDALTGKASLQRVRFAEDPRGGMAIWKMPELDPETIITDRYLVVVDIGGRGMKSDWSVIAVFDRSPMRRGEGPEVVAQWRGHTDYDLLAWTAARIAVFYDNALLVIESNTIETREAQRGVACDQSGYLLIELRDAYDNLYARTASHDGVNSGAPVRYGFHTNTVTKPMIVAGLVAAIRDGLYTERDEECLSEYLTYEQRDNGSYGAIPGRHDDILMTRAIGLHVAFHEMETPVLRSRHRPAPRAAFCDPYG